MLRAPACCHGVPSWGPGCARPPQKPAWALGCSVVLWCRGAWLESSDGEKCRAGMGDFSSFGYFWDEPNSLHPESWERREGDFPGSEIQASPVLEG